MADLNRPDYGVVFALQGEKLPPDSTKMQLGWVQEMMPYQWQNFLESRQDEAITYLMQKGVPEYSATQEYIANKSTVLYQGNLYIATATVTGVLPTVTASWKRISPTIGANGAVGIGSGGTGATDATAARTNLGLGSIATANLPATNGVLVRNGANSIISRTLVGTAGDIVVANPDGASGNITLSVGSNVAKTNQDSTWTSKAGITLPRGTTAERGTAVAGKIRYNTTLQKFEGYNGTSWEALGAASEIEITTLSGDGVTTVFTLNTPVFSELSTDVYIGGLWQDKGTYSVSDSTLTFSEAPTFGTDNIQVVSRRVVDLGISRASQVSIEDTSNYYTSPTVEGALREVGEDFAKLTSYSGNISAEVEWPEIPAHTDPAFDVQAQALANRVEALRKGEMAQFQLSELGAAVRLQSSKFSDFVNVRDFGATGDGHYHPLSERFSTLAMAQVAYPFVTALDQSIDWAAFQAAVKNSRGDPVYASAGEYVLTDELLIDQPVMQIFGQGKGYARNLLSYAPELLKKTTCLTFIGTGKKSIKTRVKYRASAADSADDPISTAINVENDGVTLQNLMVNLYCDYTDTSPTNYGADWDVGVFHGSRQDFRMIDVNVVGYWREASIWLDSTRGVNLPELNGYPATYGAGADGSTLVRVQTIGGRWGVRKQGPRPKQGLMHFGFQYKRAAKFAFSSNPIAGDTLTVGSEVYTFQNSGTAIMGVAIGANIAATIDALIEKLHQFRIVPYDELTFIRNGDSLEVYSISNTATPLSTTSASIAVQTISGGAATQTESISDPAKYYDDVAGLVDDGRNSLGASDFVLDNCVICSVEHHSKYRMTDKSDVTDFEESKSSGAIWIDGIGGNAMMHRQFAHHTRFQSVEPFCVRIGFAGRVRFLDCTEDSAVGSWKSTTGASLTSADTFGKVAASATRSAMIQHTGYDDPGEYFPLNKNRNQVYSHFYLQGFDVRANRDLSVGRNAVIGETNSGNTTGFAEIKSGANANSELRFSTESVSNVARIRTSPAGGLTVSLRPSGTVAITDALFISSSNFQVYSAPRPNTDNTLSNGTASNRWSVVHAGTSAINTSDERHKTPLRSITSSERAAALEIKASIGAYQWLDSIAQKGEEGARIHWGVGAQTVGDILRRHGLDPEKYAFWCYDEWEAEYEPVMATRLVPDIDDYGLPCEVEEEYDTGEVRLVRASGNRYGVRLDQLLAFIIAAI